MKINTKAITGYDNMSAEEKLAALEAFEYEVPSDNSAELEKAKSALSKANSEAAEWKRKHNALLSEEEKKKQEAADNLAAIQKELDELRHEKTVADHKAQFLALGFDDKLAAESAGALADGNMSVVFKNQQKFMEDTKKRIEAEALKKQPELTGGTEPAAMTKASFLALSTDKQLEYIKNNPNWQTELK